MSAVLRKLRFFTSLTSYSRKLCTSTSKQDDFYDIVIVGGGMVGGSLACALGKLKLKFIVF